MAKLHEILAVERQVEMTAKTIIEECTRTFAARHEHFYGFTKTYNSFSEEGACEDGVTDQREVVTSVDAKLKYVMKHVMKWFDVTQQKDASNQEAKADVVLENGTVLIADLPATFLLGMETKLKNLKKLILSIPTLKPGCRWEQDETLGEGVFRNAHNEPTFREIRKEDFKIITEATEHHAAQYEKIQTLARIGKYVTQEWSTAITVAHKSQIMGRLDELERAVKRARVRANNIEIDDRKIGELFTNYILRG